MILKPGFSMAIGNSSTAQLKQHRQQTHVPNTSYGLFLNEQKNTFRALLSVSIRLCFPSKKSPNGNGVQIGSIANHN